MLLHAFSSFQVTSELVKIASWGSSSDEETPKDKTLPEVNPEKRLRAGGSKLEITIEVPRNYAPSKKTKKNNTCSNEETKPKRFEKLKKKLFSAKRSMFRRKKRNCLNDNTTSHGNIRHSDTFLPFKSSNSLKEGRHSYFKADVNFLSNKSLLIPNLNLKPIAKNIETQNSDIVNSKLRKTEDKGEPDENENRNQESQYETALNNSIIVNAVCVTRNKLPEKRVHFKEVELRNMPISYWENRVNKCVLPKRSTISLPLLQKETFSNKAHLQTKTESVLNIPLHPSRKNKISSKYAASMYDFKKSNGKVSCSNLAKSSKKSSESKWKIPVESVHTEGYGSIPTENIGKVSYEQHPSHNSQNSERLEYLFKSRLGQGDQPSRPSWTRKLRARNTEERERLLESKSKAISACVTTPEDALHREHVEKPVQRFYVLLLFCAVTCMQAIVSNTSNSIADSLLFAYPNSTPKSVALLSHWGSFCLLFCILPACYLLHKKGLRLSILIACGLCTLGAGIRCLPLGSAHFIFFAHIGSILNSIGGVIYGPAVVMVSSTWFPVDERTFATGLGTSLSLLGSAATYYLGPLIVSDPSTFSTKSEDVRQLIQHEILFYMTLSFIVELCLFILLMLSFPNKPQHPTSKASYASLTLNLSCLESVKLIINNHHITLLSISSALMNGASTPWLSVLSMALTELNISQSIAANIGFWTMICGCFLSLVVSKLSDRYPGYIKENLLTFAALSSVMFTWVALMIGHVLPYSQGKLLTAILTGISSSWATSALFYELGAEIAYPVPESIVAGYISSVTSLAVATVNAYIYFFSSVDLAWLSYALVLFSLCSVLSLFFVTGAYNRSKIDRCEN